MIYAFTVIAINIQLFSFLVNLNKLILKYTWRFKGPKIVWRKMDKVRGFPLWDIKIY